MAPSSMKIKRGDLEGTKFLFEEGLKGGRSYYKSNHDPDQIFAHNSTFCGKLKSQAELVMVC